MAKKRPLSSKHSKFSKSILIILVVIIGLITWLSLHIFTVDTNLIFESIYHPPNFIDLENLYTLDTGTYAAAIDGVTVAGENPQEIRPTASMAKMILGLAILQAKPFTPGSPGETITITDEYYHLYEYYYKNGGSISTVEINEEISEYDALVSVFLASSNNIADTLAIWAFGSLENYQNYATDMLIEQGINNTTIGIDASGFDASTTSTASDLAKIATLVMKNPILREIVGTEEYTVPVVGELKNTNKILGQSNISGVKTGYIGEESGYCLASAYLEGNGIVTVVLMGAPTREASFSHSLNIINLLQGKILPTKLVAAGDTIGYYDSWWTGKIKITANEDVYGLGWANAEITTDLNMTDQTGTLTIMIGDKEYKTNVSATSYIDSPDIIDRLKHVFGWANTTDELSSNSPTDTMPETINSLNEDTNVSPEALLAPITNANSANCTINFGTLMLINPNFTVENDFIATRRTELISIHSLYGIVEGNPGNGDNLLDAEAAIHINNMIKAYEETYPGHTLETRSCFRAVGTKCGRLCAATGASDHHTGLTCDLLDPTYGTILDVDDYEQHIDWQWLKTNSYKYGFIDRFPESWAGGSMNEPLNVDENGSTGLYETWHYRYVGNPTATEIATGKYNNGEYDSLEHYLKVRGLITDLKTGTCKQY